MVPLPEFAFLRLSGRRNAREACHRLAIFGNDDVVALRGLVDKAREAGFCFVEIDLPGHGESLWPVGQVGQARLVNQKINVSAVNSAADTTPCRRLP